MVAKLQSKELFCKKNARAFTFCIPLWFCALDDFKMCLFAFLLDDAHKISAKEAVFVVLMF